MTRSAASRAAAGVSAIAIATGSPTKRTRSAGSGGCGATKITSLWWMTSSYGFVGSGACPTGLTPSATASAPVSTATTPGIARAAAVSTRTIVACAWGERTKHAYAWPGTLTSSPYVPRPTTRRASSLRRTGFPMPSRAELLRDVRNDTLRGRGLLELQRVAVGVVAQHLHAPARLHVLDVLDAFALERRLHRGVVRHFERGVARGGKDRRARAGRKDLGLDDVDLRKDPGLADPVTARLEVRTLEDVPAEDAAVEVLRPLRVGGHDALVLHANDVGSGGGFHDAIIIALHDASIEQPDLAFAHARSGARARAADLRSAPPPVGQGPRPRVRAVSPRRDPRRHRDERPQRRVDGLHRVRRDVQQAGAPRAPACRRGGVRERHRRDERVGALRSGSRGGGDHRHRRSQARRRRGEGARRGDRRGRRGRPRGWRGGGGGGA